MSFTEQKYWDMYVYLQRNIGLTPVESYKFVMKKMMEDV